MWPFKRRRLSGGQLLVSLAESMLAGGGPLAHLDPLREDGAGRVLRTVAEAPPPETASQLLPRRMVRQWQAVVAELAGAGVELDRMLGLPQEDQVTLDLDSPTSRVTGSRRRTPPTTTKGSAAWALCSAPGRSGGGWWQRE